MGETNWPAIAATRHPGMGQRTEPWAPADPLLYQSRVPTPLSRGSIATGRLAPRSFEGVPVPQPGCLRLSAEGLQRFCPAAVGGPKKLASLNMTRLFGQRTFQGRHGLF